jgi:4-amino-4-deoxy-L-arabinose transferase-like glycosyltransferase
MTDASGSLERSTPRRQLSLMAGRWGRALRTRRVAVHVLAVVITLYGGLLRLDAFVSKYGAVDHPAWARIVTHHVAPLAGPLAPERLHWPREARPFVGGDPINYLKYAREMESFYQPHVREPIYLALTRAGLWAMSNQDVGIGLASGIGSTAAVFATYLLGAALLSPLAGLLAALFLAVEFEAITWAPDGWRDDTFTATVLLCAWALLRLRDHPSPGRALLAGVLAAVACLTRITALSFVLPAAIWYIVDGPRAQRPVRARLAAIALGGCAVLVAPYLISCGIATGDPFLAINYHTVYYRHAEGRPVDQPMGVAGYLKTKLAARPVETVDVGFNGLVVQPFSSKWNGLDLWVPGLGRALRALALAGLAVLPFTGTGRLFLVILLASLLPYMFTWNLGDGGAWRFTMHAYPFYLAAGAAALVLAGRALRDHVRRRALPARGTLIAAA